MTYKDIQTYIDNVSDDCTLICPHGINGYCPGGMSSDGRGIPIEPPCTGWDDDTDVNEELGYYEKILEEVEAREDEKIKKQEKNKQRAELARATRHYVFDETIEIKMLRKKINNNIVGYEGAKRLAETFRIVGDMMDGKNSPVEMDEWNPEYKQAIDKANAEMQKRIDELLVIKKNKIKEFNKKRQAK